MFYTLVLSSLIAAEPLPGTKPLEDTQDLALQMVRGIDKYLDRAMDEARTNRPSRWKIDTTSEQAYRQSIQEQRNRFQRIIGAKQDRLPITDLSYVSGPKTPSLIYQTDSYQVHRVRWPVLPGVDGEGLLVEPKTKPVAQIVAIPDADQAPEQLLGLLPDVPFSMQFARRLAENGCRIVIPTLIDRRDTYSGNVRLNRWTNQPHREFIYRMAAEMGDHIIGYEVQKIRSVIDSFSGEKDPAPIGLYGYGEGALLAECTAALDNRIRSVVSSGAGSMFGDPNEPIYRNLFGISLDMDRSTILHLIRPASLLREPPGGILVDDPPVSKGRQGAAPGKLVNFRTDGAKLYSFNKADWSDNGLSLQQITKTEIGPGHLQVATTFLEQLTGKKDLKPEQNLTKLDAETIKTLEPFHKQRHKSQLDQLVNYVQKRWRDSEPIRQERFAKCDASSPEKWDKSCDAIRDYFWEEVIGKLPPSTLPIHPKSRLIYDEPKWRGYEVTLDLYPDVYAYGILLLPKEMNQNERRPVVVCQHGLEGRPQDVCNPKEKTRYYNSFGAQLADMGYIVFAPQNPYIGKNEFRQLQRKANPLKLSLFSFIIRQQERILDWLITLPYVDANRIAFYGLSYGGKTAMRVPAMLKRYCLSICSGDFNEWIGKNVSIELPMSYMWTQEYEMVEFNLGSTFNYAEMAYLIAPRPFMVERGHNDGVGIDEMVAYEYAKVRHLYANRLKIPERTRIEWFPGGHEIRGIGTFEFLSRHLRR